MSNESKIKIINNHAQEILEEFDLDQAHLAYARAKEFEEIGLDITVKNPTITETLCHTLGIEHDEKEEYEESVIAEIHDHDGSCCTKI